MHVPAVGLSGLWLELRVFDAYEEISGLSVVVPVAVVGERYSGDEFNAEVDKTDAAEKTAHGMLSQNRVPRGDVRVSARISPL
jgi:hypothetical protein